MSPRGHYRHDLLPIFGYLDKDASGARRREDGSPKGQDARGLVHDSRPTWARVKRLQPTGRQASYLLVV